MLGQYDVDAQTVIEDLKKIIRWQHKMLKSLDHPGETCQDGGYAIQVGPGIWEQEQCEFCALIHEGKKFMTKEKKSEAVQP